MLHNSVDFRDPLVPQATTGPAYTQCATERSALSETACMPRLAQFPVVSHLPICQGSYGPPGVAPNQ